MDRIPLSSPRTNQAHYADKNLIRGIEGNSGRDALLSLEEIIRSRRPAHRFAATDQKISAASTIMLLRLHHSQSLLLDRPLRALHSNSEPVLSCTFFETWKARQPFGNFR